MDFEHILCREIKAEAKKLSDRYHQYHNWLDQEFKRRNLRSNQSAQKNVKTPECWQESRLFNPFYVHKHAKFFAKLISKKIYSGEYAPKSQYVQEVPKPSGGTRDVSTYQIPDAAVSRLFFTYLMKKNRHRFSSYAYAYRNDKTAHFAVQDISLDLSQTQRIFIAEYDFSKFFDNISHEYIFKTLSESKFFVSETEQSVIKAFLNQHNPSKGIPQGTSISLFLANVACWPLDRSLEGEGLKFARYADDTIIWSLDYGKICKAVNLIYNFSLHAGIPINMEKSEGISLLIPAGCKDQEMNRTKTSFDFLGYSISPDHVRIKQTSEAKIKSRISYLIYTNLLKPVIEKAIKTRPEHVLHDRELLVCLQQIRRYLYGDLSEYIIKQFLFGGNVSLKFKGVMSYYPLIDDEKQLKQLDGWLVSSLMRALKKRYLLLENSNGFYYDAASEFIKDLKKHDGGKLEIPSFMTIYKAIKRSLNHSGLIFRDSYTYQ